MKRRISVQEAWTAIDECAQRLSPVRMSPLSSLSRRAAKSVHAPISLPPFDNSAVDGYAIAQEAYEGTSFDLAGTIGAGQTLGRALNVGEACRIMTGAKIPEGTIAIAMQEHVRVEGPVITLEQSLKTLENIRMKGEDVAKGTLVLEHERVIQPADVALLCALGLNEIEVFPKPSVAIVSTGSELVDPGTALADGQVYYCTGPMFSGLCEKAGATVASVAKIADDEDSIVSALQQTNEANVLIMIGGMADGIYDHGRRAFERIGVETIFFEGQWRPGKPLLFGKRGPQLVFGLPGNPVAAFVMFKVFIEPALQKMSGGTGRLDWRKANASFKRPETGGRSLFLRGRVNQNSLELLPGQGSHQLFTLSLANAIVWVRPDKVFENEVEYIAL